MFYPYTILINILLQEQFKAPFIFFVFCTMMRILFAQLCKLYILIAIATIAVGAPLTNGTRESKDTYPICPDHHPVYQWSLCATDTAMRIYCLHRDNPNLGLITYRNCQPGEICIERLDSQNLRTSHAYCMPPKNVKKWDNFRKYSFACSVEQGYVNKNGPIAIQVAATTFGPDGKPIQVFIHDLYSNGDLVTEVKNQHNVTAVIKKYNEEKLKFCFATGSMTSVHAYAAAWDVVTGEFLSLSES
jgi:hypothetical protein